MTVKCDLLIRGGTVIDPAANVFGTEDILIREGRIVPAPAGGCIEADKEIDASDCLVMPGLIDYHNHVFHSGTAIGMNPDSVLLPQGVTTTVDQGSSGVTNVDSFINTVVNNSQVRVFAYLHVSPAGLATLPSCLEPVNPAIFDTNSVRSAFEKYPKNILGLKIRLSREVVGGLGLKPLTAMIQIAEEIGCKVVVHTTNPPGSVEELANMLRSGDVFTHMYQGKGSHIIDDSGQVRQAILEARKRGVIFDTADGRVHYSYSVARTALLAGFEPDVISTDLTRISMFEKSVFGLPLIMSKYLNLGMTLQNIVKACTDTPARLLRMQGKLGCLTAGAFGDVAVFKLKTMCFDHRDNFDEVLHFNQVIVPMLTVLKGKVAYRNLEI